MAGLLDLKNAKQIWHGGQEVTRLWVGGAVWAKPTASIHPLAIHAGIGAGQMPILTDMLWPGGHTVGDDAGTPVVTGLTNLGGTGPYHAMTAVSPATAPRLSNGNAMLFRIGDLIRMANDAGLNGVHVLFEAYMTNPGFNETQAIASHSGTPASGVAGAIEYVRLNANNRFRLRNTSTSQATYATLALAGAWKLFEMRYAWSSGSGVADIALDGVHTTGLILTNGGDLYVNQLGNSMRGQLVGAMLSVVSDPAHSMVNPEQAVLDARSYLIGRRA